ncbi:hypothetical protein JQC72_11805 [Polycladomyces sp. WAk]|uniref:Uncharacterized protein n=1 Tax=Polycladomyces zharkentensis TaxID=2807616 RepID=A0ABS2WKU3_9BACL|nr:hypothetical protein [Polycladomyces sp. WAk]MBN2910187.1 hypothetical protein [Polycladomyces sp. WAk]
MGQVTLTVSLRTEAYKEIHNKTEVGYQTGERVWTLKHLKMLRGLIGWIMQNWTVCINQSPKR